MIEQDLIFAFVLEIVAIILFREIKARLYSAGLFWGWKYLSALQDLNRMYRLHQKLPILFVYYIYIAFLFCNVVIHPLTAITALIELDKDATRGASF